MLSFVNVQGLLRLSSGVSAYVVRAWLHLVALLPRLRFTGDTRPVSEHTTEKNCLSTRPVCSWGTLGVSGVGQAMRQGWGWGECASRGAGEGAESAAAVCRVCSALTNTPSKESPKSTHTVRLLQFLGDSCDSSLPLGPPLQKQAEF